MLVILRMRGNSATTTTTNNAENSTRGFTPSKKMADDEKPNKRKNDKWLVERAIPNIAKSLHSIIIKSKDKDFQERCRQKTQVSHFDDLPETFELTLWEIARLKMGVCRSRVEDRSEVNNQVVPQSPTSIDNYQKTANSVITEQEVAEIADSAHHENAVDGAGVPFEINKNNYFADITGNLNSAHKKHSRSINMAPTNILENNFSQIPKMPTHSEPRNQPEVIYVYDDDNHNDLKMTSIHSSKADWLDDFTQDSYWMNEASCDNSLQEMSSSQLDHDNITSRNLSFGAESVDKAVVADDMSCTYATDLESNDTFYKTNDAVNLDNHASQADYSRTLEEDGCSHALGTFRDDVGNDSDNNFHCLREDHNRQAAHHDWMSFQETNTLIDDFDALADFFDDLT